MLLRRSFSTSECLRLPDTDVDAGAERWSSKRTGHVLYIGANVAGCGVSMPAIVAGASVVVAYNVEVPKSAVEK